MAERGSCNTSSGTAGPESGSGAVALRVVTLRPTRRPRSGSSAPEWAAGGAETGAWGGEPVRPSGPGTAWPAELPWEPDPEAAAFLNAPRRPLGFYVAPFGTPPFGNPPGDAGSVSGGPATGRGGSQWGPAYPAGA